VSMLEHVQHQLYLMFVLIEYLNIVDIIHSVDNIYVIILPAIEAFVAEIDSCP
jgi:hypothetical protein